MHLTRFSSAQAFLARAQDFLLVNEAHHTMPIGVASILAFKPDAYQTEPYFAVVEENGVLLVAAVRTPPYNVILSLCEHRAALELIAQDVHTLYAGKVVAGVIAPKPVSIQFAEIWRALTGQAFHLKTAERAYKLEKVKPISGVSGHMRRAVEADRALMIKWVAAFQDEAFGGHEATLVERVVNNSLTLPPNVRGAFLWEDEHAVTLVGYGGPTPNSMRIGPVYTPPEFRRRGYASACTAGVSQYLLDSGRKFVTLFTDLANPISNHIYQEIGYVPVCDADEYKFEMA
jgi:predicted GNAT family acetyltransferase